MLEEATSEIKDELVRFADLKSTILNSPHGPYLKEGDKYPYKYDDFIPKDLIPKVEKKPISTAERNRRLIKEGDAMMSEVNAFNRARGKRGKSR